jgi:uncharacterized membrane protein YdfJ with MMPL/SSD domain
VVLLIRRLPWLVAAAVVALAVPAAVAAPAGAVGVRHTVTAQDVYLHSTALIRLT